MKLEVTVSEIAEIYQEIQERPGQLFEMIRLDIREVVGKYMTTMMHAQEWISLRTTNIIEQLNKKFGFGTKTMEILAGEMAF